MIAELCVWKLTEIDPCFGEISKLTISMHCEIPKFQSHPMALVLQTNIATSFSKTEEEKNDLKNSADRRH